MKTIKKGSTGMNISIENMSRPNLSGEKKLFKGQNLGGYSKYTLIPFVELLTGKVTMQKSSNNTETAMCIDADQCASAANARISGGGVF